jgi:hypothetical protein
MGKNPMSKNLMCENTMYEKSHHEKSVSRNSLDNNDKAFVLGLNNQQQSLVYVKEHLITDKTDIRRYFHQRGCPCCGYPSCVC